MKAFGYLLLMGIFVTAWCPWFEVGEAAQLISNSVRDSQSTLQNGCVLTIKPNTLEKMPFGYKETVSYNCTLNGDFLTEGENVVYVPFFKQVINIPHPLIK